MIPSSGVMSRIRRACSFSLNRRPRLPELPRRLSEAPAQNRTGVMSRIRRVFSLSSQPGVPRRATVPVGHPTPVSVSAVDGNAAVLSEQGGGQVRAFAETLTAYDAQFPVPAKRTLPVVRSTQEAPDSEEHIYAVIDESAAARVSPYAVADLFRPVVRVAPLNPPAERTPLAPAQGQRPPVAPKPKGLAQANTGRVREMARRLEQNTSR
jgi:hypothetical protein